jgi:hypothetical protein
MNPVGFEPVILGSKLCRPQHRLLGHWNGPINFTKESKTKKLGMSREFCTYRKNKYARSALVREAERNRAWEELDTD